MKIEDINELVRVAFKHLIKSGTVARIKFHRFSRSPVNCPFYYKGRCTNPLNHEKICTETPIDCPYLTKVLGNSVPKPALLVPIELMLKRDLIDLEVDEKEKTIYVRPKGKFNSYARIAYELLYKVMDIYGSNGWKVDYLPPV